MRHSLYLLLVACTGPSLNQVDQQIVGGQSASTTAFPTVVDIENGPGYWFCTGTLVDKDWVLTAAHCVIGETARELHVRFDNDDLDDITGGTVINVAEVHSNPGYDDVAWDNDIAVIKLARSVTDRAVTPIHRDKVPFGTRLIEVGYGDADNYGDGSGVLRQVNKTSSDCAAAGDPSISNANLLCFDANDGQGSCFGDSGGPAFLSVNGKLEVAGVTSGGSGDLCGVGWDLYTSVTAELEWVDRYIPKSGNSALDDLGEVAGCSTTSGSSLWLALGLLALRRRRRRSQQSGSAAVVAKSGNCPSQKRCPERFQYPCCQSRIVENWFSKPRWHSSFTA